VARIVGPPLLAPGRRISGPVPATGGERWRPTAERQHVTVRRRAGWRLDARRALRTLGISVNPPPPPERPARFDSAVVTYPSATTARDRQGREGPAHVRRARRRPLATPESIPPLPAPVVGELPTAVKPLRPGIYAAPPGHRRAGPPNYLLRRVGVVAAIVAIGLVSFASYSVATPDARPTALRTTAAARPPAVLPKAPLRPKWFVVPRRPEPGGGTTLFPSHRLVAYYGVPNDPHLGVLGNAAPDVLWPQLLATAAPYEAPQVKVVPSYELVAFTAEAAPGPDGDYTQALAPSVIEQYRQVVDAHDGMLILDIQPGRSNFLADAKTLEPWLTDPHVALALDPEWELQPGQLPGKQVGHTDAQEINAVSTWLEQLTAAHDLPQKLLLVHQFQSQMIRDKQAVALQPDLSIAFNMDGFGASENKLGVYHLVASDHRFPVGYKLFYTRDRPLQAPQDVLALEPQPSIIEYE
jgi:hypothetical protein